MIIGIIVLSRVFLRFASLSLLDNRSYNTRHENQRKILPMKPTTEMAIRSIAQADEEIKSEHLEQAIDIMKGRKSADDELEHVLRRKEVMKLLHIHRRTLDYYIDKGYLTRVYGAGQRALGVSRSSYLRFIERRTRRKCGLAASDR